MVYIHRICAVATFVVEFDARRFDKECRSAFRFDSRAEALAESALEFELGRLGFWLLCAMVHRALTYAIVRVISACNTHHSAYCRLLQAT